MRIKETSVDIETGLAVKAAVLAAVAEGDCTIDMTNVTRTQSIMLSILLSAQRAAKAKGAEIRVVNAPSSLTTLAALYGVSALLRL